jgi:hypothetical protein
MIDELDDEEECHSRADKEKITAIDRRIVEQNKAIIEYNPLNGSNQQKKKWEFVYFVFIIEKCY